MLQNFSSTPMQKCKNFYYISLLGLRRLETQRPALNEAPVRKKKLCILYYLILGTSITLFINYNLQAFFLAK